MFQKIETIKKNQMTNVPHQVTKCHKGHDNLSLDLMTTCQVKDYSIIDSSIGDNNTHRKKEELIFNIEFFSSMKYNLSEYHNIHCNFWR